MNIEVIILLSCTFGIICIGIGIWLNIKNTERNKDLNRIKQIQKDGHPYHCACRQVWGDGECECYLYQKGYDPYAWMKSNTKKGNKDA